MSRTIRTVTRRAPLGADCIDLGFDLLFAHRRDARGTQPLDGGKKPSICLRRWIASRRRFPRTANPTLAPAKEAFWNSYLQNLLPTES